MAKGSCCICGKTEELTFEHIPPKSAYNVDPIFIQNFSNLYDSSSKYFEKKSRSNRGLGAFTLCGTCNNLTGSWYVDAFSNFTKQGMSVIEGHEKGTYLIIGKYNIKPLNILKQIICMHLSADKSGSLRNIYGLQDFILDKTSQNKPDSIKVFLYSTLSKIKRLLGYTTVYDQGQYHTWSEINYQPFGYFLAINSPPAQKDMFEISNFNNYKFDEQIEIAIKTPYLEVTSPIIGEYYFP